MSGYVIAQVEIHDPEGYEEYRKLVAPTIAKYGGRFIVRGGKSETLEGTWSPKRLVVVEFESVARAREWYFSPEYQPAKELRQKTSTGSLIVIEGA
jgi:uncharacterized protein (DUF1330 family)